MSHASRRTLSLGAKALLLMLGYVAAAEAGNLLSVQHAFSTLWPPAGLYMAVLLVSRRRDWPVLVAAGIAGNVLSDILHARLLVSSAGFAAANTVEAVLGALLVGALVGMRPRLDSLREVLAFLLGGVIVAPAVGAGLGTLVVMVTVPGATAWTTYVTWWIGDALGIVMVGSLVLTGLAQWDAHRSGTLRRDFWPRVWWSVLIAVPFAVLAFAVFAPSSGETGWKFLTSPAFVACGIVGGPFGAAIGVVCLTLGGLFGALSTTTVSPIAGVLDAMHLFQAQAYFVVEGLTALALAGAIAENEINARRATESADRFQMLFDSMREGVANASVVRDARGKVIDWRYLRVNAAHSRLTGLGEVQGRLASEVIPGLKVSNPDLFELYAGVVDTHEPAVVETFMAPIGKTLSVSATSPAPGEFLAVFEDASERAASARALAESARRLEHMVYDVAEAMGNLVEARDPYTQGHQVRVAQVARLIGAEMRLSANELDEISMAALLHDIGKMCVPAEILTKPGSLSEVEMAIIREHPERGFETLRHIDFPWRVAQIVRQHHERMDGSGYPHGLSGEDILMPARIIAVADVIEAIASHRPYRPAMGLEQAADEIASHVELYDRDVIAACTRLFERGAIEL